ncbi:hypothetical protein EROP_01900 [Erysipelotrichaceae bacterium OPF54]|nr:hypothetical protein EROP_01900 [Erysipelotrichaceae bacterium OPF54]
MVTMTEQKSDAKKTKFNQKQKGKIRFYKYVFLSMGFIGIALIINRMIYLACLPWMIATTWDTIRDFIILLLSFFSFAVFGLLDKKLKR